MPKLTYWVAENLKDSDCYSLIGKTRKAVLEQLKEYNSEDFEKPVKKVITYKDAFDLFEQATQEGGGRTHAGS